MSIRIDASGDGLERTSVAVPYTICGWARMTTDRDSQSCICSNDDDAIGSGIGDAHSLNTTSDGVTLRHWDGAAYFGSVTLTVGTWFFWAVTVASNGTSVVWYHANLGDSALVSFSGTFNNDRSNKRVHIGNDVFSEWWDGRIGPIKMFNSVLTADELELERQKILPVALGNVYLFSPTFPGAGEREKDYSGNGRDWTVVGTLTDEDHPPVSWGSPSVFHPFAAAATAAAQTRLLLLGVGF